jgi:hypothetical protein
LSRIVEIASFEIAAEPDAWRRLGFEVGEDGRLGLGDVELRLAGEGAGRGIVACGLRGAPAGPIDGLPTLDDPQKGARHLYVHPNTAFRVDHVVVLTPDAPRTFAALEAAGSELRRVRETTAPDGSAAQQGFFWAGKVIVEVGGPAEPSGDSPARFWGLTLAVQDIDAAAQLLGDRLGRVKAAVQPGRRIATVRREAGAGLPLALITPHGA